MTTLIHISQDLLTFIKLLVAIVVQLLGLYVGGKKLWQEVKKDLSKKPAKSAKSKKRKELKFE